MLFNHSIDCWPYINQNEDMEFDYIAIDKLGQIAVFSTFNRGYIPECVTKSFEKFLVLDDYIEQLPKISESILKKGKNETDFQDWIYYASLGLFAYDNQDVHRVEKLNQYDIICQPKVPLKIESTSLINDFEEIIPVFDLIFGEDITFESLQKSLK